MACLPSLAWGQNWSGGPTGPISYNGGNVGIGTPTPTNNLTIDQGASAGQSVSGVAVKYGTSRSVFFQGGDNAGYLYNWGSGGLYFYTNGAVSQTMAMAINNNGNVGIATTTPQYLLSVNGQIGAKDVIVTNIGWSDYVFDPGYRLRPLTEVASYIKEHHHLPEIPSASEVEKKGLSLSDMQSKLLQKIEELTLHMIQQDKENRELRERLAQLEAHALGSGAPTVGR